jgi:acyl-coenzyme A thioesterase PaaI-like protein
MSESFKTRLLRWQFNFFPVYRRTGARITHIANDYHKVDIKLPLTWKTRNYVGTMFGGSMYAAVDPIYMIMFIKLLGPGYIVWDKAATIHFRRPGRSTLFAKFHVEVEELETIRRELECTDKLERIYEIDLIDEEGTICASVEKTLYFRKKNERTVTE